MGDIPCVVSGPTLQQRSHTVRYRTAICDQHCFGVKGVPKDNWASVQEDHQIHDQRDPNLLFRAYLHDEACRAGSQESKLTTVLQVIN